MDKIEKIRQEIKRRYAYENEMYHKKNPDGRPNDGWAESLAIMGVLEELLTFLDTLSEESDKSLDEAAMEIVIKMHPCLKDCTILGDRLTRGQLMALVKAGAEWRDQQIPKLPPGFEDARDKANFEIPHSLNAFIAFEEAFKAGAEWMAEKGETRVLSTESDYDSPGADYGGVRYLKYRIKDDTPIGTEFIVQIRKKED